MNILHRFITGILVVSVSLWALTPKELATSINLAGKQRMLTQKMAKEALLIQHGIDPTQNRQKLQKTMERFDRTLRGLLHGDKTLKLKACQNPEVKKALLEVQKTWQPMRNTLQKILNHQATPQTYQKLREQNPLLLQKMHSAVERYVRQNDSAHHPKAQTINLAGKERMLTQKIAKALLEHDTHTQKTAQQEFEKILNALIHGDRTLGLKATSLPHIQKLLHAAQTLWQEIRPTLSLPRPGKTEIKETIQRLDAIMSVMDKAVTAYEKSVQKAKRAHQLSTLVNQFMQSQNRRHHLINLAGKQRMRTQQMTKLALLVTMQIQPAQNRARLKAAADDFARTLQGILHGDPALQLDAVTDPASRKQTKKVQKIWIPFAQQVQKIIQSSHKEPKALAYLITHNQALLAACEQLVQQLKQNAPQQDFIQKAHDNIIDIAGRERMLIEKMTKEKLMIAAGIKTRTNHTQLEQDIATFDQVLGQLRRGDPAHRIPKPANPKLVAQLQSAADLWQRLKPIYTDPKPNKKALAALLQQHTMLLREMDRAVKYYETLADY